MVTVLVAENSFRQHSRVSEVLKLHFSEECSVREARNTREIFHSIEHDNSDIIVLDMDLPGVSCPEVIRFLRASNRSCVLLPMAELSSFDPTAVPNDQFILDYLLKPYSESELILTLEEAISHCRKKIHSPREDFTASGRNELTRTDLVRKKIEQYIQEHYSEILSMQDVAQAMNYSETHFCRLFKQCFDVNFSVYLNQFRVEQARQMLAASNQTVKEVSISCGYRDTSYFIRVFKRFTGMTPSDYRIHSQTMTAKKSNKS